MDEIQFQARFELEGVFWLPNKPDERFPAHLSSTAKHIEMTTSATVVGPERLFPRPDLDEVPDILHGMTTSGPCTLIGFQELDAPGYFDGASSQVIRVGRFRVSGCLFGFHLDSDAQPTIASAQCTYSGLAQWFPFRGEFSTTEEAISFIYPKKALVIADFSVIASKTRISLKVFPKVQHTPGVRRHVAESEVRVEIVPHTSQNLEWFFDLVRRFENFLSLGLGTSTRVTSILLRTSSGEGGWFTHQTRTKADKPDPEVWVRCEAGQLTSAILAWLTVPEEFRPLENLIYGTIRNSSLFVETEFLSLAQAIESMHRLTDDSTLVPSGVFKQLLEKVTKFIADQCGDSRLMSRLMDAIRYANEPAFKNRIESLMARVSESGLKRLVGDPAVFEQTLRQNRNYFTHPGIDKGSKVLNDAKELFLFNQKLHAFLRLLMLLNVGLPEALVIEPVYRQSKKWR